MGGVTVIRAAIPAHLRLLTPFWILVIALYGLDWVLIPMTGFPDQVLFTATPFYFSPSGRTLCALIDFLLAFAVAQTLLTGEIQHGVLGYLDGLPPSRFAFFCAKWLAGMMLLLTGPILKISGALFFHAMGRDSLSPEMPLPLAAVTLLLHALRLFAFFNFGLLAAFLGRLNWALAAVLVGSFLGVRSVWPEIEAFDPRALNPILAQANVWSIPWAAGLAYTPPALAWALSAWWVFARIQLPGTRVISTTKPRLRDRALGKVVAGLGALFWLVALVGVTLAPTGSEPAPALPLISRAHTQYYLVYYPERMKNQAHRLLKSADTAHERVCGFLDAEPQTEIVLELGGSDRESRGWDFSPPIPLSLAGDSDWRKKLGILGRQTSLYYIHRQAGSALEDQPTRSRFLSEGLADYIEYRFFRYPFELAPRRLYPALVQFRKDLRPEDLFDDRLLATKHDSELSARLGEVFVAALVERYGDRAPAHLLRTIAKGGPGDGQDSAAAFWDSALGRAGFEFKAVMVTYESILESEVIRHREALARIPRLIGSLIVRKDRIGIAPQASFETGWRYLCRIRTRGLAGPGEPRQMEADENGLFWVHDDSPATGGKTGWDYQLGLFEPTTDQSLYQPWIALEVPEPVTSAPRN